MLTLFRKSPFFNERIDKKFEERIEKLPADKKEAIISVKKYEEEAKSVLQSYEDELKKLELKYDRLMGEINNKKSEGIKHKEIFSEYWLRVLSNNKITKDFIAESDKEALKTLINIRSEKLEDANSFKLVFEFAENEYFTNTLIEKTYTVTRDLLLERISSTVIDWKDGKNLCMKKVTKTMKNKSTGEKKTVEKEEKIPSFFNFFTNLRLPAVDEMGKLDFEHEKELGAHLDMEYSIGIEFTDEILPYSLEYFVGVTHETEEYEEYFQEREMAGGKKKKKY